MPCPIDVHEALTRLYPLPAIFMEWIVQTARLDPYLAPVEALDVPFKVAD